MDQTEYEKLLGSAIRFVSFRPHSAKELRDFCIQTLKRHHTTAPLVIDRVMDRLVELGYADDQKFVEWWVGQRSTFKPKGKRLIMLELQQKGVAKDVISVVLESCFSSCDRNSNDTEGGESGLARKSIERKLVMWDKLPSLVKRKKLYDFLLRRGFGTDTIRGVVDEVMGKE